MMIRLKLQTYMLVCYIVTPSPAMMHMMDKPSSCSNFENYQRPEGFPVGTFNDSSPCLHDCVISET